MGDVADKAESLQNLFNCTVPLISGVSININHVELFHLYQSTPNYLFDQVFGLALIFLTILLYLVGFRFEHGIC